MIARGRQRTAVRPPPAGGAKAVATLHQAAVGHWAAGRATEAIAAFGEIVRRDPKSADAHHNLATALFSDGRLAEAAAALTAALGLRPSFETALVKLATVMEQLGRETEAAAAYRRLARLTQNRDQKRLFTSRALSLEGASEEAEAELRRALAASPDSEGAHVLMGQLLLEKGDFEAGAAHLVEALDVFPDVFQQVAASRRMTDGDRPLLERVSRMTARPGLATLQRAAMHFGLGKGHDDLGDYARAIEHYDTANALRARSARLDRTGVTSQYDRTIATYTRSTLPPETSKGASPAPDDETPVLILGMPRSGTTLVEQILSSHPAVAAGGELSFWRDRLVHWNEASKADVGGLLGTASKPTDPLREILNARPVTSVVEKAARAAQTQPTLRPPHIDAERLGEAARDYLALLRRIGPTAQRVTDKAPFNYERIGLIRSALPRVRIVHCRRQPVDTCLSIYFTNYKGRQAWSRADILFQFQQYERLMAHWRATLSPDRFIEVDYEAVVADRDGQARRLVDFCGLAWDDACLAPERNLRVVKSASLWQARQPTYTRSLDRWRRYEPWLGELEALLVRPA